MKKLLNAFIDIFILVVAWLLCLLAFCFLVVVSLYFPEYELAGIVAFVSVLVLVVAYSIFWFQRQKRGRQK
jgi:hypothetical protein